MDKIYKKNCTIFSLKIHLRFSVYIDIFMIILWLSVFFTDFMESISYFTVRLFVDWNILVNNAGWVISIHVVGSVGDRFLWSHTIESNDSRISSSRWSDKVPFLVFVKNVTKSLLINNSQMIVNHYLRKTGCGPCSRIISSTWSDKVPPIYSCLCQKCD